MNVPFDEDSFEGETENILPGVVLLVLLNVY